MCVSGYTLGLRLSRFTISLLHRWGDKCGGGAESIGKPILFPTCARSSGGCWQTMTSEAAAELRAVELPPDPRGPEGWKP